MTFSQDFLNGFPTGISLGVAEKIFQVISFGIFAELLLRILAENSFGIHARISQALSAEISPGIVPDNLTHFFRNYTYIVIFSRNFSGDCFRVINGNSSNDFF